MKPAANCIVVSDLHCGCGLALCPPEVLLDDGGVYKHSKLQAAIYAWWQEFWEDWVPNVTRGEPYCVVVNGDPMDGVHHNAITQFTHNLTVQDRVAYDLLKPVYEKCEGRFYMTRGTEVHGGQSGQFEEKLAERLKAVPNSDGQHARWELWLRIGPSLCHFSHHIGTSGSNHYETTAVTRELAEAFTEAGRWRLDPPDVVVRSHRHRNIGIVVPGARGYGHCFTTAGWQAKTPLVHRIAGGRQALPQFGGSLIRHGDEDLYVRHFLRNVSRPKTETPEIEDAGTDVRHATSGV